jgi:hypothetical protein
MDEEKDDNPQSNQIEPRIIVRGKILTAEEARSVKIVAPGPESKPPPRAGLTLSKLELLAMAEYYRIMANKYKEAFDIAIKKVWEKDKTIELLQNLKVSIDSLQKNNSEQDKIHNSQEKADRALRELEKTNILSLEIINIGIRWVKRPRIPHKSMQDFLEDIQTDGGPYLSVDNLKKALPIMYEHGLIDKVNGRFVPIYDQKTGTNNH